MDAYADMAESQPYGRYLRHKIVAVFNPECFVYPFVIRLLKRLVPYTRATEESHLIIVIRIIVLQINGT